MFGNINFKRFHKESKVDNFEYTQGKDITRDYHSNPRVVTMDNVGFNLHVSVMNYMAESVMLCANTRSDGTRIHSLLRDNIRTRNNFQNHVIVTILYSEAPLAPASRDNVTTVRKSEIRIPGHMLNTGSVFIDELDCYITTESNLEATRELIAHDLSPNANKDIINLPENLTKPDPALIYNQYKSLVNFCIQRKDRINVRVGYDVRYGTIPEPIKNLHVSIVDSYFVPFTDHKLMFDPTLDEDEFVIENLYLASQEEFRFRFSELARHGSVYIDGDEVDSLSGKFYGLAIFANRGYYASYVHQRKSLERFDQETLYLAEKSGNPRLKEEIISLKRDLMSVQSVNDEKEAELVSLRSLNKRLVGEIRQHEATISKLETHHAARRSADVIIQGLENESQKITNDSLKIEHDRKSLEQQERLAPMQHKATVLKQVGEIMKSGWGIVTGCIAGVLMILATLKKYDVRLVMGSG